MANRFCWAGLQVPGRGPGHHPIRYLVVGLIKGTHWRLQDFCYIGWIIEAFILEPEGLKEETAPISRSHKC